MRNKIQLQVFQVDAFTDEIFGGNPAAICPLKNWLTDDVLQKIAMENSVAETAFYIPMGDGFEIRWFTPEIEMDLCGHATLAAAHVITKHQNPQLSSVKFYSNSGILTVTKDKELLTLDFPSRIPEPTNDIPQIILDAFAVEPIEVLKSRDYILVFKNEKTIRDVSPDQGMLNQINLDPGGIVVTSKGDEVDFVSRYFTPQASIFEDPVTGSAHCSLTPYWSNKLNKQSMNALQLSSRIGKLYCEDYGERVFISGNAITYLVGEISI